MSSTVLRNLAVNDNADPHGPDLRSRVALSSPLRRPGQAPPAGCRRWHTVRGERVLSSIVAVEQVDDRPVWRISATLWGSLTAERRRVALLLVEHLATARGQGPVSIEVHGSTTVARRALTGAEARLVARDPLAVVLDPAAVLQDADRRRSIGT